MRYRVILTILVLLIVSKILLAPTSLALYCEDTKDQRPGSEDWGECPSASCKTGAPELEQCVNCFRLKNAALKGHVCVQRTSSNVPNSISTEIGRLQAEPNFLAEAISRILVYLAGGVSLFLLISGAIKYLVSSGNPEGLEDAKGTIASALGGFLLIFLAVFLLRFLGVDVLHIPGFSTSPGGGVDVPY